MNATPVVPDHVGRGMIFLSAHSWAKPSHVRQWVAIDGRDDVYALMGALQVTVDLCKERQLESVVRRLDCFARVKWGPESIDHALRPTYETLEVVAAPGDFRFRIRGESGGENPLCTTPFRGVDQFAQRIVCGERFFPDEPINLHRLIASAENPDDPFGPTPGRYQCRACGSSNIIGDADASWDSQALTWVMGDSAPLHFYCQECEQGAKVDWVPDNHTHAEAVE